MYVIIQTEKYAWFTSPVQDPLPGTAMAEGMKINPSVAFFLHLIR